MHAKLEDGRAAAAAAILYFSPLLNRHQWIFI